MEYTIGQKLKAMAEIPACAGSGYQEVIGVFIHKIEMPEGNWIQLVIDGEFCTVKESDILGLVE